jgi:hypothetical protein
MKRECKSPRLSNLILCFAFVCSVNPSVLAQGSGETISPQQAEFSQMAERIAAQRLAGGDEDRDLQVKALAALDDIVLTGLSAPREPDLAALNRQLASLVTRKPGAGESFRVLKLAGSPAAYALAVNFGVAGPSAVRVYTGATGHFALTAQIDRATQKDFFDEYLELVPISGSPDAAVNLFLTVVGRTDDLQTGAFSAWSFDRSQLKLIWASDLLQESSYEAAPDGFRLTYCAQTDEENPRVCRRMTRDRYAWDGAEWKRVEQTAVPVPKR